MLEAGSVDAVVTDPPYGIALENHARGKERRDRDWTIAGDNDQAVGQKVIDWADFSGICTVAFASPSLPWPGKWQIGWCGTSMASAWAVIAMCAGKRIGN